MVLYYGRSSLLSIPCIVEHSSLDRLILNLGPVPDRDPDLDRVWTLGTGTP